MRQESGEKERNEFLEKASIRLKYERKKYN